MPAHESLLFYTVSKSDTHPVRHNRPPYRLIVGIDNGQQSLWLGNDPKYFQDKAVQETFALPPAVAEDTFTYFREYYTTTGKYEWTQWNCHVGAAAMTGEGFLIAPTAISHAEQRIHDGRPSDLSLQVGAWGVMGYFQPGDPEPIAVHSVVGLSAELCLETDEWGGPFSITSYSHAMAFARRLSKGHEVQLYATPEGYSPAYRA